MLTVAVTGNIGSGKSVVSRIWAEQGVPLVSADQLAREVVAPGTVGLAEVVECFGEDVLRSDGSLDRAYLRDRVFRHADERKALEAILHPRIDALRREWMEAREGEGHTLVVAEIPLLFEVGLQSQFDLVVLVDADPLIRLGRVVEQRGLSEEEARLMIEAQMPAAQKQSLSHVVIRNEGSLEQLKAEAQRVVKELRERPQAIGHE